MIILGATLSFHSHAHTARLFSNDEVPDVLGILGLGNKLDVVLFDLFVGVNIFERAWGETVDVVEAVFGVGFGGDPIFFIESWYLVWIFASHCYVL